MCTACENPETEPVIWLSVFVLDCPRMCVSVCCNVCSRLSVVCLSPRCSPDQWCRQPQQGQWHSHMQRWAHPHSLIQNPIVSGLLPHMRCSPALTAVSVTAWRTICSLAPNNAYRASIFCLSSVCELLTVCVLLQCLNTITNVCCH